MAHHKKRKPHNSSSASCYCKYYKKVEFKGVFQVKTRQEQLSIIKECEQRGESEKQDHIRD